MPYHREDGSCIDTENTSHRGGLGFGDLSVSKIRTETSIRGRNRWSPVPSNAVSQGGRKLYRYGGQHPQDGYRIRRLKRLERKTEASVQRRRTCIQEKGHPSPAFAVACRRRDVRKADIRFRATSCSRTASSGRRLSFRGRTSLWKPSSPFSSIPIGGDFLSEWMPYCSKTQLLFAYRRENEHRNMRWRENILPCLRLPPCRRGTHKKSSVPCLSAHRKRHRERDDSSVVGFLPNRWNRPFGTCSFDDGAFFGMADPVGDFFLL